MKQSDDGFAIWGGISGCQSLLPLALSEGWPLELVTSRPAQRFRLPRTGRLEPGYDADLAENQTRLVYFQGMTRGAIVLAAFVGLVTLVLWQ